MAIEIYWINISTFLYFQNDIIISDEIVETANKRHKSKLIPIINQYLPSVEFHVRVRAAVMSRRINTCSFLNTAAAVITLARHKQIILRNYLS